MNSRRNFIKTTGKGAALAAVAPGIITQTAFADQPEKNIRIGIIGAENSHTIGFGKIFNTDKKFPGMEVKYVWGETDEFAKNAMEKGN
ncbi:MAG: twin-arginine translocation signal domain-containing protein, partial [Tangfeifania sp.]